MVRTRVDFLLLSVAARLRERDLQPTVSTGSAHFKAAPVHKNLVAKIMVLRQ
jgi:hypothetical protein